MAGSPALLKWADHWLRAALQLVWPALCPLCDQAVPTPDPQFCPACRAGFEFLPPRVCSICGRPFYGPLPRLGLCPECLKIKPAFDVARSVLDYRGLSPRGISLFKYHHRLSLLKPWAGLMAENLQPPFYPPEFDLIVPIPLSAARLRQRGFNQAWELSWELYRPWRSRLWSGGLIKLTGGASQASLKGERRREAVNNSMGVKNAARIKGRSVLVVDDVFTTGSTVAEAARALKEAGARRVGAVTLARAIPDHWRMASL